MTQSDADRLIDCLYDWITPGEKPSPQGAKTADYRHAGLTHLPSGQPFNSLAEVRYVMHMDDLEKARPDWQDSFTLLSDGPLDVNEAPAELIAAVLNIPLSQAQAFALTRAGKDGVLGTSDDILVKNATGMKAVFGLSDHDLSQLTNQISYTDTVRRLESKGEAGGVVVTISAVTRLRTSPPNFLQWTER
jgi:type II secretory pathway component PulK